MRHQISPWCLHWGRDGELDQSDRQDLLGSLVLEDKRLAHLVLLQTSQWSWQAGPSVMPHQSCHHA